MNILLEFYFIQNALKVLNFLAHSFLFHACIENILTRLGKLCLTLPVKYTEPSEQI